MNSTRLEYLQSIIDQNVAAPIVSVGPSMLAGIIADRSSARAFIFKRAVALKVAAQFRELGRQTGDDHSANIKFKLSEAAHWRRLGFATAPRRLAVAA